MLTRNYKELIILPVLFCLLIPSGYGQTDIVNSWKIYLDDSLIISDHMARLCLEQKPISVELSVKNIKPKSWLTICYQSDKPYENRQQLYIASEDSLRLTQRYFKPNKRLSIAVSDLLSFQQEKLWLYYSNGPKIKPGWKPFGHVILRVYFKK